METTQIILNEEAKEVFVITLTDGIPSGSKRLDLTTLTAEESAQLESVLYTIKGKAV